MPPATMELTEVRKNVVWITLKDNFSLGSGFITRNIDRLTKLFRKVRVLLTKRLDPLVAALEETEPTLVSEYKVARKLVDAPTTADNGGAKIVSATGAPAEGGAKAAPAPQSAAPESKAG